MKGALKKKKYKITATARIDTMYGTQMHFFFCCSCTRGSTQKKIIRACIHTLGKQEKVYGTEVQPITIKTRERQMEWLLQSPYNEMLS